MKIRVLLIEDNLDLAASVCEYLTLQDIAIEHCATGEAGIALLEKQCFDVLLLDLMLPDSDGLDLCHRLRAQGIDTPVLMLTARDSLDDKIAGFSAGSDDYLVKPFALKELVSRVNALAKWRSGQMRKLQVGALTLELDPLQASRDGKPLKLAPTGYTILEALMRASPNLVSKQLLEQTLWPDEAPDSNALKVHLFNLRQQVDKPFATKMIHTLPHKGFVLKDV